ncbi:MAG TPA: 3-dehydroquinate synthase [Pyrinomonadaceae bacterium]|nr:3-dehydroquinate synthase [Pyrinomonadaceae bacterium]
MPAIPVRLPARSQTYQIKVGAGLLRTLGEELRASVGPEARRAALITNRTVFELYGRRAIQSLRRAGFAVNYWLMRDGERQKSFRSLQRAVEFLSESGLQRNDAVVALGGGVVGDLAGFAAAIYLRGVSFVQAPTTLLAQIDASVGGKTGINLPAGKNLVGAFHQPSLVVIDVDTLRTLPRRELTSGFCEMVKQGAVGSRKLFDQTVRLLSSIDFSLWPQGIKSQTEVYATQFSAAIAAHCRFKASIVAGDEREHVSRTDRRSRRILNFGHTTAHALEKVTNYQRFRHGEAVGYGMLVAAEISKSLGMLPSRELELLRKAVTLCGPLPRADDLSTAQIIEAMAVDKKAVRGKLKWVLLERIGRPRIVDANQIETRMLRAALAAALCRH